MTTLDKILFVGQLNQCSEPIDTIMNSSSEIDKVTFYSKVEDLSSVEFALLASFISLVIASIFKYFISNYATSKEWWLFFIELPIDSCLVILTLISTVYIKYHIGWGVIYLLSTIGVISICSITRRKAMKFNNRTDEYSLKKSVCYSILTIFISLIFCGWIIYVIS